MKNTFQSLRRAALLTAMGLALAPASWAQGAANYPAPGSTIKIVVGYAPGGPTDLAARLIAGKLQTAFGVNVVVENKPGAGSNTASELVAAAEPNGYTLLVAAAPLASNPHFFKKIRFDPIKSFEPISQIMSAPSILSVVPTSFKSVAEVVDAARKNPGKLSYASSGPAGTQHFAGELFSQKAGVQLLHVPYKGSAPALNDLMGGQVSMGFITSLGAVPYYTSGKLRPLAVAAKKRLAMLPDVPTMAEAGFPGVEMDSWSGVLAPARTPADIVAKLHREVVKALQSPDVREKLTSQGAEVVASSPAEFKAFIAHENQVMGQLAKIINLTLD